MENIRHAINCEIFLTLTWYDNCVITRQAKRDANPDANPPVPAIENPTGATQNCICH